MVCELHRLGSAIFIDLNASQHFSCEALCKAFEVTKNIRLKITILFRFFFADAHTLGLKWYPFLNANKIRTFAEMQMTSKPRAATNPSVPGCYGDIKGVPRKEKRGISA